MKLELVLALAAAALSSGCALEPGHGFATLERAIVTTSFEVEPARALDDALLTDLGYVVTLDELRVELGELELQTLVGAESPARQRFDPANPPEGYSLCHGGHCHAADGRLVPYAEVEAELAGGGASYQRVVRLPIERTLDWRAGEAAALDVVEPSAELPEAELRRAVLRTTALALRFSAESGALPDVTRFEVELPLALSLAAPLEFSVDRDAPERLSASVELRQTARLFDGVDLAALSAADGLDDPDDPLLATLVQNVTSSELSIFIQEAP